MAIRFSISKLLAYGAVAATPIAAQTSLQSWPVLRAATMRAPRLAHQTWRTAIRPPAWAAISPVRPFIVRPSVSGGDDYYMGSGGEWTTNNNWSLGFQPNSIYNAVFSAPPTPTNNGVYVNTNASTDNLTISSTNQVIVQTLSSVSVYGTSIVNQNNGTSGYGVGGIQLDANGAPASLIIANANTSLSGGGTVYMEDPSNARIYGSSPSNVLTNVDNTIEGTGNIGYNSMALVNSGTIEASGGPTRPLTIQTSNGTTNTGILEASGSSNLILDGDTYTNAGGTILASGSGALVTIQGATINGGTLNTSNGGVIQAPSATLNGITNAGTFEVINESNTTIEGTITNTGIIEFGSTGSYANLVLGSNVTLNGGGTLTLNINNWNNNNITGAAAADVLTNVNNTIMGSGNIGLDKMALVNQGTINANQTAAPLVIQTSNGATNTGILEATGGASLVLNGDTYTNTGGTILASGAGSAVTIQGATINGGTLSTSGGGVVQGAAQNNATLNNVTNTGTYAVVNLSSTTIEGTITNSGTIQLNSEGSIPQLIVGGSNVTLTGGGTVTLNNSSGNQIFGSVASDVLTNVNNTIQGSGNIGMNKMGLVNQGTIDANQSTALYIQTSSGTTNTGTLEATAGANLILEGDTYTNTNGTILASGTGSAVTIQGATISGGTLNTAAGGVIDGVSGTTLNGVTNAGTFQAAGQNTSTLEGTITNTGTIQVNAGGGYANLNANGAVTLTGGGALTLQDASGNSVGASVAGSSLTNVNNTITGSGTIGTNNLLFQNDAQGVVDAISSQRNSLTINTGTAGAVNAGIFEASSGGTLVLQGSINNAGGTIEALAGTGSNAGGSVSINGAAVTGGTLNTLGTGVNAGGMTAENGALLSGVTNNGTITIPYNTSAQLAGTVTNNGTIQFECCSSTTYLNINGNTTLNGSGIINLNPDVIQGVAGTEILTNNGNTIEGNGNIGNGKLGLINNAGGTILANQSSPLVIHPNSSGFTNNGTVQANAGSTLDITGGPFNNFSNNTLTGGTYNINGGTLQFDNANIVTNAANIILTGSGSQIVNGSNANALANFATNAAGGIFTLGAGRSFTTGANFTNVGTLNIGSGDTFKVAGSLTNFASSTLTGGAYDVTGTLQFGASGSSLTTNAANLTLTGTGAKLIDLGGNNLLAGFNTNAATGIFTVAGAGSFTTAGAFTNAGTMNVEQASALTVTGTLTNNTGASVNVGINSDTGDQASVGLLANSGTVTIGTGATLTLTTAGTDTNAGTIAVNGSTLDLSTSVGLGGRGAIVLTNGVIQGVGTRRTLTNSSTIEGSGTISNLGITNKGALIANQSAALVIAPNSVGLNNEGTISVSAGDTMQIGTSAGGALLNYASNTLTGGTYTVAGNLRFGASGTSIATNDATITLSGSGHMIDFGNHNILAGFNNNAAAGAFALTSGAALTTNGGSFTNAGLFTVGSGSTFTVGGSSFNYTQTSGATTVNGTLTSSTLGTLSVNGGSLDGVGTLGYNVVDASTLTPGDSAAVTGKLSVADTYTQSPSGSLDIQINGSTAGTNYDQLKVTKAATLGGTLNVTLGSGFTPTVGQNFTILTASAVSDTFSAVNGLAINGSEHFVITYKPGGVILTVVSGALPASSPISNPIVTQVIGSTGKGRYGLAVNAPGLARIPVAAPAVAHLPQVTAMHAVRPMDAFSSLAAVTAPAAASDTVAAGGFGISSTSASSYNSMSSMNHMRFECGVDLKALLQTSRKKLVRALWASPDSPEALAIGYMNYTGSH